MSPSHRHIILTNSPDGPITAYDLSSSGAVAHFSGSRSPRRGLTVVGKSYIAASHISLTTASSSIHLYNWYSPNPSHNIPVPEPVGPLASTPDGSYLFAGGISGNIHAFVIPSRDIFRSIYLHDKPVSCIGISEDGSVLISGGDDGKIVIAPLFQLVDDDKNKTDFTLHKFGAHDGSVTAIACCTSKIISSSMDSTCKIWSLLNGALLQKLEFPCEILGVVAAASDPTETRLYFAGSDGSIYKGSTNFGRKRKPINQNCSDLVKLSSKHNSSVVSVVMADEGKTLVSAAEDGSLFSWDTETGKIMTGFGGTGMGSSISDMVVMTAGGSGGGGDKGLRMNWGQRDDSTEEFSGVIGFGLSAKLMNRTMEDRLDLEDVLMVAKKDKTKAIDILESAIAMYEKLLELILREAQRGSSTNGEGTDEEEEN